MSNCTFSAATANTHESRMLKHTDGLKPFRDKNVGVLLLQEVLGLNPEQVNERLNEYGYKLVNFEPILGLAIAVKGASNIRLDNEQSDTSLIHEPTRLEKVLKFCQNSHRLRERGIIGSKLIVGDGGLVTVATAHPIVFIRALSRHKQIIKMGDILEKPFYSSHNLIVGADMNHYPGPRKVDLNTQKRVGLKRLELSDPTWCIEGSRHEWIARIGSFATGRSLDSYDAELDAMLYKGVQAVNLSVIDIESDHKSIVADFLINERDLLSKPTVLAC